MRNGAVDLCNICIRMAYLGRHRRSGHLVGCGIYSCTLGDQGSPHPWPQSWQSRPRPPR